MLQRWFDTLENKHKEIDELYSTILHAALDNPDLDDLDRQDAQQVLHTVICAQEPLAVSTLSSFLKLGDAGRVHAALRPLWSVLHVSGATELVTTLHASFPDFMLDPSRSKHYYCDLSVHNQILALRCFDCFRNVHPQFNICGLESSYLPDDKVEGLETRIQDAITAELFYAARYWAIHLTSAAKSADIIAELEEFFSMRLLLWMEVMNLKKCASSMPDAMQLLEKSITECPIDLRSWMRDAWWFTKIFSLGTVSNSTPHIYTSMPLLLPESSPIAQCYTKRMKGVIRFQGNAVNRHRHPLVATWTFDAMVSTSTFSPDGARIALAVKFDILLLDSTTGRQIFPPFKGHKSIVDSIGFSPDGRYIVSGSRDSTVRIWSTQSGRLILGPLEHNDIHWIMFVAFLSDGTRVISGSDDSTICVWDARSGDRLLDWTTSPEKSFTFYASDGKYVASCNWKRDITVWNAQDGHVVRTLYHSNCEISWVLIGISPDGTQIASRSQYGDIYLWDIESGKLTLEITCNWVTQALAPVRPITFSSDGSRIASAFGASGEGIYVWDARVGRLVLGPLEGHAGGITSFKFSPNDHYIISSSTDKVLCLWDTRVLPPKSDPLQGHADSVLCVDYAPAGDRIITSSADNSTCVWDAESGEMVLEISIDSQGSRNISDISPDGTRVVSDTQAGFSLLDVQTGDVTLGLMKNRTPWLAQSAEFSPDSAHLLIASSSMNGDIRVVAADTGQTLMVIHLPPIRNSPNQQVLFAALSPNNSHIAVGSSEFSLTMYDTANGRLLYGPIDGYNCSKYSVSFSPDGTRVAAGSHPNICVRDAGTGKIVLGPLEGHTDSVTSIQFSRDGTRIVSCGYDNAVCLWDAETGQKLLGPARWHTGVVNSARISPDGNHVVTGSGDRTIRVTDIRHELNSVRVPFVAFEALLIQLKLCSPSQISDSLAPTGSDWELKADGWVVDTEDRLLVWVPPELRASLARPRTKLLISRKGWFRLNFADALLGESWKGCYWPESLD
ncbi:unnamed protein product [Rhizoctonia solani]|uniref:Vegetative incompatibility protein HET-E-1 n=1 Tax=Rhizoctonia solani TaxID=456999 RepID=A0A8H3HP81_9AGAM|nr:unnamed protein product [Rhizoctonia solani]